MSQSQPRSAINYRLAFEFYKRTAIAGIIFSITAWVLDFFSSCWMILKVGFSQETNLSQVAFVLHPSYQTFRAWIGNQLSIFVLIAISGVLLIIGLATVKWCNRDTWVSNMLRGAALVIIFFSIAISGYIIYLRFFNGYSGNMLDLFSHLGWIYGVLLGISYVGIAISLVLYVLRPIHLKDRKGGSPSTNCN